MDLPVLKEHQKRIQEMVRNKDALHNMDPELAQAKIVVSLRMDRYIQLHQRIQDLEDDYRFIIHEPETYDHEDKGQRSVKALYNSLREEMATLSNEIFNAPDKLQATAVKIAEYKQKKGQLVTLSSVYMFMAKLMTLVNKYIPVGTDARDRFNQEAAVIKQEFIANNPGLISQE